MRKHRPMQIAFEIAIYYVIVIVCSVHRCCPNPAPILYKLCPHPTPDHSFALYLPNNCPIIVAPVGGDAAVAKVTCKEAQNNMKESRPPARKS